MRKGSPVKIKSKNKLSKPSRIILIASAVILVVAGGVLSYLYFAQKGPFTPEASNINYGPATSEEINAGNDIKEQNSQSDTSSPGTGSDTTPTPPQGDPSKSTVGVEITAANQNGSTINIRTLIQSLSSNGTCTLSMNGPAGKTYTASSKTQLGPSTSTCMGFDVPVASLSPGDWTVTINYEDSATTGSATRDVTVL